MDVKVTKPISEAKLSPILNEPETEDNKPTPTKVEAEAEVEKPKAARVPKPDVGQNL